MCKYFENKVIAVVGASGYIGSHLVSELLDIDCIIKRVSRDKNKLDKISSSIAKIIDYELDTININWESIVNDVNIIYYLSSQTSTYTAEKDIESDYKNSVLPFLKLLECFKNTEKKPTVIFSSAVTVCGLVENLPVDESFQNSPITIYDTHKLLIENYLKFFIDKDFIKGTTLRLCNVYGPGVSSSSSDRGILNLMIKKALNKEELTLFGSGEYIRDYIYIDDVVSAFIKSAENIDSLNSGEYIISSGIGFTIKESFENIISKVKDITNNKVLLKSIAPPENLSKIESRNFIGNSSRFKAKTDWKPNVSLIDGIEKTISFFLTKENKCQK